MNTQMLLNMNHAWCTFWWNVMEFMCGLVGNDDYAFIIERVRCPKCKHEDEPCAFEFKEGIVKKEDR